MSELKAEWIEALSAPDVHARANAAAEIHRVGRQRADGAVRSWWENAELATLCGSTPAVTVGLAVRQETFARIRAANDFPALAKVPPDQDAIEFELHFAGDVALDILTSRAPEGSGAIAKFLAKQGEGIQQVEVRCSDVDRAAAILKEHYDVQPIYPEKRPGASGTQVNFFLVLAPGGGKVLIELYEPPDHR